MKSPDVNAACRQARAVVAVFEAPITARVPVERHTHVVGAMAATARCGALLGGIVDLVEGDHSDTIGVQARAVLEMWFFGVITLLGDQSDLDRFESDHRLGSWVDAERLNEYLSRWRSSAQDRRSSLFRSDDLDEDQQKSETGAAPEGAEDVRFRRRTGRRTKPPDWREPCADPDLCRSDPKHRLWQTRQASGGFLVLKELTVNRLPSLSVKGNGDQINPSPIDILMLNHASLDGKELVFSRGEMGIVSTQHLGVEFTKRKGLKAEADERCHGFKRDARTGPFRRNYHGDMGMLVSMVRVVATHETHRLL